MSCDVERVSRYAGVRIGPVVRKDVMRASTMLEHEEKYACILAFDVKVMVMVMVMVTVTVTVTVMVMVMVMVTVMVMVKLQNTFITLVGSGQLAS